MRNPSEDPARRLFYPGTTDSERAAFEAGIALSTILHQFQGMPLPRSRRGTRLVERAIEESISAQPFRSRVTVRIKTGRQPRGPYGYSSLHPSGIEASVEVRYGSARLTASMRWIRSLNYPLMHITSVTRGE